jgi:hypothetical protein
MISDNLISVEMDRIMDVAKIEYSHSQRFVRSSYKIFVWDSDSPTQMSCTISISFLFHRRRCVRVRLGDLTVTV